MAKKKAIPQSPSQTTASKNAIECHLLSLSPTHCCTIVESINEGVFTIDAEKQITYFNPAAERITGFRPAEDIPVLIDHFLRKFNVIKCRSINGVSPDVLNVLLDYPFPGNIRELENIIEYAFVACRGALIDREHLPKDILEEAANEGRAPRPESHPEAEKICAVLARCNENRLEASRLLGTSRTTLWRKIRKFGLG